jgi:hypothetical protein
VSEVNYKWTLTSTGDGKRIDGVTVKEWTFYIETAANSTCTCEILSAQDISTSAIGVVLGSSQVLSSAETRILQFTGPFGAVYPRVVGLTGGGTVTVRGLAV